MQVDRVGWDAGVGVVLAEDELGGLAVVVGGFGLVLFAEGGKRRGFGAIAGVVGLMCLRKEYSSVTWSAR